MSARRTGWRAWLLRPIPIAVVLIAGAAWIRATVSWPEGVAATGHEPELLADSPGAVPNRPPEAALAPVVDTPAATPDSDERRLGRADFPPLSSEAGAAWGVRTAPPAPAMPASAPPEPVFPYKFVGLLQEAGAGDDPARASAPDNAAGAAPASPAEPIAILWSGDQTVFVHPGDVVDNAWHVDAVANHVMTVTHVPSRTTVSVSEKIQ